MQSPLCRLTPYGISALFRLYLPLTLFILVTAQTHPTYEAEIRHNRLPNTCCTGVRAAMAVVLTVPGGAPGERVVRRSRPDEG